MPNYFILEKISDNTGDLVTGVVHAWKNNIWFAIKTFPFNKKENKTAIKTANTWVGLNS